MENVVAYMQSPLGIIKITGNNDVVTEVWFVEKEGSNPDEIPAMVKQCISELYEYFDGKLKEFTVAVETEGTDFQKRVWNELTRIPYGDTTTYGDIAKILNEPEASQAVGAANGKNPIAIIIPCHRVIGHNGKLTGYAGGMWRKSKLLELEGNVSGKNPTLF